MKRITLIALLLLIISCQKNPVINLGNDEVKVGWIAIGNSRAWYINGYANDVADIPEAYRTKCKKITLYKVDLIFTYKGVDGVSGLIKMGEGETYIWRWEEL
jgi:hypothetical protein